MCKKKNFSTNFQWTFTQIFLLCTDMNMNRTCTNIDGKSISKFKQFLSACFTTTQYCKTTGISIFLIYWQITTVASSLFIRHLEKYHIGAVDELQPTYFYALYISTCTMYMCVYTFSSTYSWHLVCGMDRWPNIFIYSK